MLVRDFCEVLLENSSANTELEFVTDANGTVEANSCSIYLKVAFNEDVVDKLVIAVDQPLS